MLSTSSSSCSVDVLLFSLLTLADSISANLIFSSCSSASLIELTIASLMSESSLSTSFISLDNVVSDSDVAVLSFINGLTFIPVLSKIALYNLSTAIIISLLSSSATPQVTSSLSGT